MERASILMELPRAILCLAEYTPMEVASSGLPRVRGVENVLSIWISKASLRVHWSGKCRANKSQNRPSSWETKNLTDFRCQDEIVEKEFLVILFAGADDRMSGPDLINNCNGWRKIINFFADEIFCSFFPLSRPSLSLSLTPLSLLSFLLHSVLSLPTASLFLPSHILLPPSLSHSLTTSH